MLKEAYAVYYTLKNYGHILKDSRVRFQQDNKAVETCFKFGSRNCPALTKIIRQIHEMANKYNVAMVMEWVSTLEQEADEASRAVDSKEAIFVKGQFTEIENLLSVKFTLDAFANPDNTRCKNYFSLRDTAGNLGTDFFTQEDFGNNVIWVFPPKPMENYAFQHMQKYGEKNKWAFVLTEYEVASPIWPEIKNDPKFSYLCFEKEECPILFPTGKRNGEMGFWRTPTHLTVTVLFFDPSKPDKVPPVSDNRASQSRADDTQTTASSRNEKK